MAILPPHLPADPSTSKAHPSLPLIHWGEEEGNTWHLQFSHIPP